MLDKALHKFLDRSAENEILAMFTRRHLLTGEIGGQRNSEGDETGQAVSVSILEQVR